MARPEIFNSDQGSQFTAAAFTGRLEAAGVAISMDGRGRAIDNVFIERLWRSVKYEEVYLKDYATAWDAEEPGWTATSAFYCHERIHQALGYRTPAEVYGTRTKCSVGGPAEINLKSRNNGIITHTQRGDALCGRARPLVWVSRAAGPHHTLIRALLLSKDWGPPQSNRNSQALESPIRPPR